MVNLKVCVIHTLVKMDSLFLDGARSIGVSVFQNTMVITTLFEHSNRSMTNFNK